jgi:hypothetical protein
LCGRRSNGDGTVPLPSLAVCEAWQRTSSHWSNNGSEAAGRLKVHVKRYPGVRHAALLRYGEAFADVLQAAVTLALADAPPLAASSG